MQSSAKKAAETGALIADEEGTKILLSELLKGTDTQVISLSLSFSLFLSSFCSAHNANLFLQALMRRGSCYLIGYVFKNSKLYLVDEAFDMISTLIVLLSDNDSAAISVIIPILHVSFHIKHTPLKFRKFIELFS